MAELVLSTVGRALGARLPGVLGSIGAAIGHAAGAHIGASIDQRLFGSPREAARLTDLHIQGSSEGASIPAVFGAVRIAGQVIWAARFKEHLETTQSGGGKGGPSVKTRHYRYTLSFAVGLCEGEIARVGRVWANGEPFDLSQSSWRVHTGGEDQAPDALIEAIEGADNAPAYRGLAYVVFEDLPLEVFGNTLPQLSFEVMRPAPSASGGKRFDERVKSVCLIPGAGEFVYATEPVLREIGPGEQAAENVHQERERANLLVSLDQLAADFPNCDTVMLVVAWFGNDLRCGECRIRPGVEIADKQTAPEAWSAGGVTRAGAHLISAHDGAPAYGGTPSDRSVLQAIAELKRRGYKVGLYPFVLMDVPSGNELPDPYLGAAQAAYPWRGRISVHPAAGAPGSADKTSAAADQVADFFGAASADDFEEAGGLPAYAGPAEWSFRRFILHHAKLAQLAGGVDAFVIGSELRGVTTARSSATEFPAVAALRSLAADVRALLGEAATITYAADWSEYSGHQPQDGSGDVFFHLDPLWADDNIDVVGIDWYPPLSDWRTGAAHLDAQLAHTIHDPAYLEGRIESGEAYDFFYASPEDRMTQLRTPITDGGYGEPWIYRAKDMRSFWANPHHDRPDGVRAPAPTAWIPESKSIWLIELGCPAIDKGANQPNLFIDPKSSESAQPHHSTGARDDLIQRRTLEAYLRHWDADEGDNPLSAITGKSMVGNIALWAWDARPFPAFPARGDVWADGAAWRRGHWLNGRAGLSGLAEVVLSLCVRAGVHDADATALVGAVSGYIVDSPASAREALEPLMAAFDFSAVERAGVITFMHGGTDVPQPLALDDLTAASVGAAYAQRDVAEAPVEARVRYLDAARDYLIGAVSARRLDRAEGGVITLDTPLVLETDAAEALAQRVLSERRSEVETLHVGAGPAQLALEAGDRVLFGSGDDVFWIDRIEDAETRRLALRRARRDGGFLVGLGDPSPPVGPLVAPAPAFSMLDLPPLPGAEADERPLASVFARPWLGEHEIYEGALGARRALVPTPATMGELLWPLWPGPVDRWDLGNRVRIRLFGGALASATADAVLDGANVFAIQAGEEWEIIQAASCELVAQSEYELSHLLRGRLGSAHAMAAPHAIGARIVKLDQNLARVDIGAHEWRESMAFVVPPSGSPASSPRGASVALSLPHASLRAWAPAHLRAVRDSSGDVAISWVRCARIGGDFWGPGEPPLGASAEGYSLAILDGDDVVRAVNTAGPGFSYSAADQTLDFGALPAALHIRVAQLDESGAAGLNSELTITL
ncbi:MAG: glycoside hydrolase/phage tail family protein [Hyphomonadaceae bacterium]